MLTRHQTRTVNEGKLDAGYKTIKRKKKLAGLDEISFEIWKTREFDDILLQLFNAVYKQNMKDEVGISKN